MLRENSHFNLEFRNPEDDAWYTARVDLSLGNVDDETTLIVKFEGFDGSDFKFSVGQFRTVAEVDEFVKRFRPLSEQFQDRECLNITKGTRVCAALSCLGDDLLYFDAAVDAVNQALFSFLFFPLFSFDHLFGCKLSMFSLRLKMLGQFYKIIR